MKNPNKVYVPEKGELVKFAGYIAHVDTSNEKFNRVCFKEDTRNNDSGLVSVTAWKPGPEDKRPDFKSLTNDAKGRYAVVLAQKQVNPGNDGKEYNNYNMLTIDFAPKTKN